MWQGAIGASSGFLKDMSVFCFYFMYTLHLGNILSLNYLGMCFKNVQMAVGMKNFMKLFLAKIYIFFISFPLRGWFSSQLLLS